MAKQASKDIARPVDVLPAAITEEIKLNMEAVAFVATWRDRIETFYRETLALDLSADQKLIAAKALTLPANSAEDEALQRFVKSCSVEVKTAENVWIVTSLLHGIHKRLVAGRKRTTDKLEAAGKLANDLHNRYVEQARRAAQAEQDRVDALARQKAEHDREQEIARLEADAVAAEAASLDLSAREQTFVDTYVALSESNTPDAAVHASKRAGYAKPFETAARLIGTKKIIDAIKGKQEAAATRRQAAAVAAAPIQFEAPTVEADVTKAAGLTDRTNYSAELLDEDKLIAAVLSGNYGIPARILKIDTAALNAEARSLRELINKWPGVRLKKTTGVV